MKFTKLVCAVVAALVVGAFVAGCASTYHPVGAPREGVVASRVVV